MARKSRKPSKQESHSKQEPLFTPVAAYVRLSVEDRAQKGNSIETQKNIIVDCMR